MLCLRNHANANDFERLKTWTGREGNIRLSEDDGPPSHTFVENDDDDDAEDEPLSSRAERLRGVGRSQEELLKPPTPPPKQLAGVDGDGAEGRTLV